MNNTIYPICYSLYSIHRALSSYTFSLDITYSVKFCWILPGIRAKFNDLTVALTFTSDLFRYSWNSLPLVNLLVNIQDKSGKLSLPSTKEPLDTYWPVLMPHRFTKCPKIYCTASAEANMEHAFKQMQYRFAVIYETLSANKYMRKMKRI